MGDFALKATEQAGRALAAATTELHGMCATARSGRSGSGLPHFTMAGVTAGWLTGFEYLSIEWRHGHQRAE